MRHAPELGLGTAQFGLAYGIASRDVPVPEPEIRAILDRAFAQGIRLVDTAPAYGDIEGRLARLLGARPFRVVSKIPALPAGGGAERAAFARNAARRSRERLGPRLDALLFHRGLDLLDPGGPEAWDAVAAELAGSGVRMGVSCYAPADVIAIRARHDIAVAQVPGNVLDQRLLDACARDALAGVEIHLRSLFLQGLLLLPSATAAARVPGAARPLAIWEAWRGARGIGALQGALGAAKSLPGVRYCVVGIDSAAQLDEVAAAWREAEPLRAPVATEEAAVIDPRCWAAPA